MSKYNLYIMPDPIYGAPMSDELQEELRKELKPKQTEDIFFNVDHIEWLKKLKSPDALGIIDLIKQYGGVHIFEGTEICEHCQPNGECDYCNDD